MDEVFYTDRPMDFSVAGDVVFGKLRSGERTIAFAMSRPTFLACCAKAGLLASELRAGKLRAVKD